MVNDDEKTGAATGKWLKCFGADIHIMDMDATHRLQLIDTPRGSSYAIIYDKQDGLEIVHDGRIPTSVKTIEKKRTMAEKMARNWLVEHEGMN